jgi:membrane associated rhomboid family serine protease
MLLISNIAIFIVQFLLQGNIEFSNILVKYFYLWPVNSPYFMPWQIITYMFLHGGFMHLFFNMFALWMFGMDIENIWGTKKFLIYYFLCGIGAGIANLFIAPLFGQAAPTIGASGAIYGILVAFGFLFPDRPIYLYFFVPVKAKYLVIIYMVIEFISASNSFNSGVAHIAHLGGGIVGFIYLLITYKRLGNFNFSKPKNTFGNVPGSGFKEPTRITPLYPNGSERVKKADYVDLPETDFKSESDERHKQAQERVDAVLDKLSQGGYQSLTEEEKRILFTESKKLR